VTGFFQVLSTFGTIAVSATGSGKEIFCAKIDAAGVFQWVTKAGGLESDLGYEADADAAGNFYVSGAFRGAAQFGSFTLNSAGKDDAFVAKLSPGGTFAWARSAGGPGSDRGYAVTCTPGGETYFTGSFEDSAAFGGTTLVSAGGKDACIAALDPSGNFLWAWGNGGPAFDRGYGIEANPAGVVWATGAFSQAATFGTTTLVSQGMNDMFVLKFGDVTAVPVAGATEPPVLFPNPAGRSVTIRTSWQDGPTVCGFYTLDGILLGEVTLPQPAATVILPESPGGALLLRLRNGNRTVEKVLLKPAR
jgi:hypothetical protein